MVFKHGEHEYVCESVSDHFQGGHVTLPYFRGQKNIENYFRLKIRLPWFSDTRNMDMSGCRSETTFRGVI